MSRNLQTKVILTLGALCLSVALISMPLLAVARPEVALACPHSDSAGQQAGMVWIPAGEFTMGGVGLEARREELPRHSVRVDGFWMDEAEVTNAQFEKFVDATGYITTAERPVD